MIDQQVYAALQAAMVDLGHSGGNVWPVTQPQIGLPAILWRTSGEDRLVALDGEAALGVRVEIDVRSVDYSETLALDAAVQRRLRETDRLQETEPASDVPESELARRHVYRRTRTYLLDPA